GLVDLAQLARHAADVLARGDEEVLVAFLDDGIAVRDDAAPASIDRDDAALDARHVLRQLAERPTHERAALVRLGRDETHAAVRELEHLQRARVVDQLLDVLRDEGFRAHADVDGEAVGTEKLPVAHVLAGAEPREPRPRTDPPAGDA